MSLTITSEVLNKVWTVIKDIFDRKYGTDYTVNSISISPGSDIADNYLSVIFSVKLKIQLQSGENEEKKEKSFDLILKSQLINNAVSNSTKVFWNVIFTKEQLIYSEIMERFWELGRANINLQLPPLAPQLFGFYSEEEEYSCLVFDNLKTLGYYCPSPAEKGMEFSELVLVFKSLARIHALSLVIEGKEGLSLPCIYEYSGAEMMFSSVLSSVMKPFTENSYLGVVKLAEKYRPDLVEKLMNLHEENSIWKRLCSLTSPNALGTFSCLCHGDARPNNIFIKKHLNEDENELRFIDFQLARYASPMTDLHYALYSSGTSREFRRQNTDSLLEIYHSEFMDILEKFSGEIDISDQVRNWNLEKVKADFQKFNIYGFLIGMIFLPLALILPGDVEKSMDQMSVEERTNFYNDNRQQLVLKLGSLNEELRNKLFEICDEMADKGVFHI